LDDSREYKRTVLRLRWVTIIITSYLILFGRGHNFPQFLPSSFILFYLFSNIIPYFIPEIYFLKIYFFYIILLFDTFMVSLGIYITSQFNTDFYLVYFLVLLFASIARSFKLLLISASVICGIYGWFLWDKGWNMNALEEGILLRIPFIFIMNLFYGFLIKSFEEGTKRIKMELKEVEESEQKYRQIVEGTHDSVAILDEKNQVKFFNQRLLHLTQYTPEELRGMEFTKIMDGFVGDEIIKYLSQNSAWDETIIHEAEVLRKSGEKRKVEVSAAQFFLPTGKAHTIFYLKDITEKNQMEERLVQSEKLRALGELASGVAHDFNNGLAVILGNTQLLLHTLKHEELRGTLQAIERMAKDSAQTVRRLQDFARKRVHQELFKLDINSIVKDAIEIAKPKWKDEFQGRGIHIEVVSNFEEVPSVAGDASELREVITNMIFNAIEAMPEGGKIEIRTFRRKEKVYIRISDTGMGMAEEVSKKVFEPFFTTKPYTNTGLGLSMSYGIIKRFGGEIEVESKVGSGTTFTIIFPVGSEEKEEVAVPSKIKKGREARILVIDDEYSVRIALSQILSHVNHQVTVAENGKEGLRLFKEKEFDIVLTDLGMPEMSGWEVCKTIKGILPNFPVGMITGWGMEVNQAEIEESGLDFVISKPFDLNEILNIVAETLESKKDTLESFASHHPSLHPSPL